MFLFIFFYLTITINSPVSSESDIYRITIKDLSNPQSDGNDYAMIEAKEIKLDGEDSEAAIVFPKKPLFSDNFKVSECKGSLCKSEHLSDKEKNKLSKCTFEGTLRSDPKSKVSVSGCLKNGGMDISLISDKATTKYNLYRIDSSGKVEVNEMAKFSDVPEAKELPENTGSDYSDSDEEEDEDTKQPIMLDKKGFAITVEDVSKAAGQEKNCCRPKRIKCSKAGDLGKKCVQENGATLCGKKCKLLHLYIEKKSESQKKKAHNDVAAENDHKIKEETEAEEHDSYEDYDSAYQTVEEKNDSPNAMIGKLVGAVEKKDLIEFVKANERRDKSSKRKNPKCKAKKEIFRSTQFYVIRNSCGTKICRKKDPYPSDPIYKDKTIEVGVFTDKHLFQKMSEDIASEDKEKIKEALIEMIHSLLVEVETFLSHSSFSVKNAFKIAINNVHIYTEHGDSLTQAWDKQKTAASLLRSFQEFGNELNSACDADEDSYDAMILLTGRQDFRDVRPGGMVGYAFTGQVCSIAPCIILTLGLDGKGTHKMIAGRLLAHEFGHLLGSEHDGARTRSFRDIFNVHVPCRAGRSLMSPSVGMRMTKWSNCTQQMIDAEFTKREKKKKNCFFT